MSDLHVLQCGVPKSGNFWLYKILQESIRRAGIDIKNFIQTQPVHDIAQKWALSYKEQADIDVLDITNQGCYYRISSIFRHPVLDLESYLQSTTHVWTHSPMCEASWDVLPKFGKMIYIVRDPRDAALSHARFMLTPYMKTYYPNDFDSPEEYLESNLESKLLSWVEHVGPYLAHADELDIHVVFYERLLLNFSSELDRLLDYLEIPLSQKQRRAVENAVTFESMKEEDPEHVQKGKAGKWHQRMTEAQKHRSMSIVGPLLEKLNYPLREISGDIRPSVPIQFTPGEADKMTYHARHPSWKSKLKQQARSVYHAIL